MRMHARRPRLELYLSVATALTAALGNATAQTPTAQPTPSPAPTGAIPKLWVAKPEWNFGKIWWGDPCSTEIEIRNDGSAPLLITNVQTSCGCTAARKPKPSLAPGESDKIGLSYDSKKGVVQVSQTVTIESNDPTNPRLQIPIKGQIRNLFEGTPSQQIAFNQIVADALETKTITLKKNPELDRDVRLKLKEVPKDAAFDIKFEETVPGQEYRVTATTRPPMKPGYLHYDIELLTGLPDRPFLKVNANGNVQERVSVQPTQLYMFSSQVGARRSDLRFQYQRRDDRPAPKVTGIKVSHPDLMKAELLPPNPNQEFSGFAYEMIKVELPDYEQTPDSGVQIEITTDDAEPRFQKFTIPVVKQRVPPPASAPSPPPVTKPGALGVKPIDLVPPTPPKPTDKPADKP